MIDVNGRLHSTEKNVNVIAGADEIFDDDKNKKQNEINTETYSLVNNINERLNSLSPDQQSALNVATKATNNETKLGYYVCDTEGNVAAKVISNATGYVLSTGGSMKVKMTNVNTVNNATLNINSTGAKALYYAGERASANNTWEAGETVEVYYDGTNFYANNVAGGGGDGVFDVSEKYPTSGVEGGNTYTLEGALTVLNTNLPTSKKKGGMSIKFVQTSDNKYVQFRLMNNQWSTTVSDWQGVDKKPTKKSNNLAESGEIANLIDKTSDTIAETFNSEYYKVDDVNVTEVDGYNINSSGKISESEISGAKISYIEASKGDVFTVTAHTKLGINSLRYGAFTSVAVDTQSDDFRNLGSNDIVLDTPYYFIVKEDGYFVVYSLNTFSVSKVIPIIEDKDYRMAELMYPFHFVFNKALNISGDETANANRMITDYIPVGLHTKIKYTRIYTDYSGSSTGYMSVCFYNEDKQFISGITEKTKASLATYILEDTNIPEGTYYVRFELWKSTLRIGKFWFGFENDAFIGELDKIYDEIYSKDAIVHQQIPTNLNSVVVRLDGAGTDYVNSDKFYANPNSVLKIKLRDTNIPNSATGSKLIFTVNSYDNNNNYIRLLGVRVNESLLDEYILVVPANTAYLKLCGRADEGYAYICDVVDISEEFEISHLTSDDFYCYLNVSYYNRAETRFDVDNNSILCIYKTGDDSLYSYQVSGFVVDSSHEISNTIINEWREDSSSSVFNSYNFGRIQLRRAGGDVLTKTDFEDFMAVTDIILAKRKSSPVDDLPNEKEMELYGLRSDSNNLFITDYITKPMLSMKLRIVLPMWMKIRFYGGLRNNNQRSYTDYYYNGDIAEFDYLKGFLGCELSLNSTVTTNLWDCTHLYKAGLIRLLIQDWKCEKVVDRNFDSEKYLGAIRATPSATINLPVIVHTSDIHGDGLRFDSAFEYADYIGADLMVNTGDNCYYRMADGTNFIQEIVNNHKTDFATCLGNHDTYVNTISQVYNESIEPFAEDYAYHKISESDITDKCYYFKDLQKHKLRIITLDIYENVVTSNYRARVSQTQMEWFISTLNSTPAGYGVIIIMHQVPHTLTMIQGHTDFNDATMNKGNASADEWQCDAIDSDYMTLSKLTGNPFGKIIDAFISKGTVSGSYSQQAADKTTDETINYSADFSNIASGVEFIMYLNGHTHRDFVGYVSDCIHRQLNINVCSASPISQSSGLKAGGDIYRNGGSNQDAFNVYTINRTDKTVGIARIGSNLSKDLRERKVMFVSYVDEV